ncbi:pyrimidine-specific ribonucleoside hydrolase RihA-like [Anopheles ziemanni]|uniref:pyrimidine-specific ribonucleoside hydrolase RihA-like n=1 Tax=Anopheles coustani TaxID=139045 RepID=UPI00265A9755|nr:pyrimidine-specific ribonucleoside hydrolase RihA-like [Anopheles coustani]XP_058174222.1 pyrimidine-specific ribonucleoside hydrolase RihA-like [Anopheles ziemanni]
MAIMVAEEETTTIVVTETVIGTEMNQVVRISWASSVWLLLASFVASCSAASKCPLEEGKTPGVVRRVILDLDAGGDDAWALTMLLMNEEKYNICVQAVTCTHGNAQVQDVEVNVLRILEALGRTDVPVYVGAKEPLITPPPDRKDSHYFWGENGFGDVDFGMKPVKRIQTPEHAVHKMKDLFLRYPNQISLLAVGPLTNVALLYKMYPEVKDKIASLYILGGNRHGVGNTAFAAEFNFFTDPEAAHIVLNNSPMTVQVFPWETVVSLMSQFSTRWRFETFMKTSNPAIRVLNKVEWEVYAQEDGWTPCDMYVAAVFLNRSILESVVKYRATVELNGRVTRGMMAILHHVTDSEQHNVAVIDKVDEEEIRQMLLSLDSEINKST